MRYEKIDNSRIEIIPQTDIKFVLMAIAKKSYETAMPRGLGFTQRYLHPAQDAPDFEEYIRSVNNTPSILLMDYINGRDCRTKVFRGNDDKWYFDSYAFEQRKVTSEEFREGRIVDNAEKFLDTVVYEVNRGLSWLP